MEKIRCNNCILYDGELKFCKKRENYGMRRNKKRICDLFQEKPEVMEKKLRDAKITVKPEDKPEVQDIMTKTDAPAETEVKKISAVSTKTVEAETVSEKAETEITIPKEISKELKEKKKLKGKKGFWKFLRRKK